MADREDYAARVRAILTGQRAPEAASGGRRVLWRCPVCGKPWLQDGARVELALSGERLATLAGELLADTATLPYATCRVCGATHAIGELSIDEYGAGVGYGFSWEGLDGAHMLGTVLSADYMTAQRSAPRAGIVTRPATCRAVLAWLATLKTPTEYRRMTPDDSAAMMLDNPPGHGAPGTTLWTWQGAFFVGKCPALDGRVFVSLGVALPPGEQLSMSALVATWRELARLMGAGHIAGETEAPESQKKSEG